MILFLKKAIVLILILVVSGCTQNDFYSTYKIDDLWRLPLKYPYELCNSASVKREHFGNDNWHLSFFKTKNNFKDSFSATNVTQINCIDSIIYGYGTKFPCYPFIINMKIHSEKTYLQKEDWEIALDSLKLNKETLYDVFDVFSDFKNSKTLPWK